MSDMDREATPGTRRRLFQFSLRSLLIAVTIVGVISGWLIHRDRQQRRNAAKIRALEAFADGCAQTYSKVKAQAGVNAKGGEADALAESEREMWLSAAELSLARGDSEQAVIELRKALKAADDCIAFTPVDLGPPVDFEAIRVANEKRCQIELKLADLSPGTLEELQASK